MSKKFIYLNNTEEHINKFAIVYMVNPTSHVNKSLKYQLEKCTNDTFGTTTQPFIKNTIKNKNSCVLALLIFYETRHKNLKKLS